jgi:hypothetical protein
MNGMLEEEDEEGNLPLHCVKVMTLKYQRRIGRSNKGPEQVTVS